MHLSLEEPAVTDIRRAGFLHDIGNLAVPNTILDKQAPLEPEERSLVARHPQRALEILSRVPLFTNVAQISACHHERLDGSGYPRGLRGEQLTLGARIVAAADLFERLTAQRPNREPMSAAEALEILDAASGVHVAAEAVAVGDFQTGADALAGTGDKAHEAYCRLRARSDDQIERALGFYRSVGAVRYVRDAEALLAMSRSA
jgi:HD-GYP domain-containing protein (c-di-GMP phosphodiesterase class II)